MAIKIRRAVGGDWQTVRDVRLAALRDSPTAFGSTYTKESAQGDDEWKEWAAESEQAIDGVLFLAFDGDECVGLVGAFAIESGSVRLISMWVAPPARRRGIGRLLVEAIVGWARTIGRDVVDLHVTEGNDAARRLYTDMGFQPMNEWEPLPWDESYRVERMELRLSR
jgi:GNAT superfamily N-acetyltransferase